MNVRLMVRSFGGKESRCGASGDLSAPAAHDRLILRSSEVCDTGSLSFGRGDGSGLVDAQADSNRPFPGPRIGRLFDLGTSRREGDSSTEGTGWAGNGP